MREPSSSRRRVRRRSNSSPSPPPKARVDAGARKSGRRPVPGLLIVPPNVDLSTSYQAGSSSQGVVDGAETDSDEEWDHVAHVPRGRSDSMKTVKATESSSPTRPSSQSRPRVHESYSSPAVSKSDTAALRVRRTSFTRSRSPAMAALGNARATENAAQARLSAMIARHQTLRMSHWLPAQWRASFDVPFVGTCTFSVDSKLAVECFVLVVSLAGIRDRLSDVMADPRDAWIQRELLLLMTLSVLHMLWSNCSVSPPTKAPSPSSTPSEEPPRPSSPRPLDTRNPRKGILLPATKAEFGYIWMTVPKNYRESSDDGIFTVLMLPSMIAGALLYSALRLTATPESALLPTSWRVEGPEVLRNGPASLSAMEALVQSRRNLLDLATFCSTLTLVNVWASAWFEKRHANEAAAAEGERRSVPRRELRRLKLYVVFSFAVSVGALAAKAASEYLHLGIWMNMTALQAVVASMAYQSILYVAIRLAHRGFTLGELGVTCFGAVTILFELLNLTTAHLWPHSTPFIQTYRLPTPLLKFQIALIAGSLLTGFLLSPLLLLSRQIARRPARRLRNPHEKLKQQRMLAGSFYGGTALVVGVIVGLWTRWCLGGRDPWKWAVLFLLEGQRRWTRPALLVYWAALGIISVAAWNRQLARSRRYRPRPTATASDTNVLLSSTGVDVTPSTDASAANTPPASATSLGISFPPLPTLPALPNGSGVSQAATEFFDAADKHVPTLSLNARRKFFHALAVAMFLPGVAIDPAFVHLALSAAFAMFIFAEYIRYFALYPFGASVHVFINEFLDTKDQGTAVLSHFYLLTGCAGSLWLEPPSRLLLYTGILSLGIGDALASVVGKRLGRYRWSATTPKTLEGSGAFVAAIVASAWALRMCGLTEAFSTAHYTGAVAMAAMLEAVSEQNDNLTLPLYLWSVLVVVLT